MMQTATLEHAHDTSWCRHCPAMIRLVDRFNPATGLNERVWVHGTGGRSCSTEPGAVTLARP